MGKYSVGTDALARATRAELALPCDMKTDSSTYLALLRGVNVGGKNKLPMKDLAAIFTKSGCSDVKTYIQSGNVIFSVAENLCAELPSKVGRLIEKQFGHNPPIVLRTLEQMAEVVRNNPFLKPGIGEKTLHVAYLASKPSPQAIASLDPNRSPGDTFVVRGQEIYLHLTNGVADCKLTNAYFDSRLKTISTGRNWRTTCTLLEIMQRL
jgi:uncharacterized protein (DUF1697 family)